MKKLFTGSHLFIMTLVISLMLPMTSVFADEQGSDNGNEDTEVKGSLTIHKFEQDPKKNEVDTGVEGDGTEEQDAPGTPLEGVTYEITQTHVYKAHDDSWVELTDEEGKTYTTITDSDGKVVIDAIDLGRYTVQEIDGPEHVNINPDKFIVDVPMTNKEGTALNFDVHIYPKNETIRGAVKLMKIDGETEEPLQGVLFELYEEDQEEPIHTLVTNAHGKIKVDGLAYGPYYFKEIETIDGYVLGSQKIEFTIQDSGSFECPIIPQSSDGNDADCDPSGKIVEVVVENYKEPDLVKEVDESQVNRGETVTYTFKNTLPGDIADYKKYVITDTLDDRLLYVDGSWHVKEINKEALDFNTDGQTLTWEINDFDALKDKTQLTISFQAKIAEDAEANQVIDNKAILSFENQHRNDGEKESNEVPVTPTAGSLTVEKIDGDSDESLKGAVFELRQGEEVIATGVSNQEGFVDFRGKTDELDYGTYELVETKAPEGYHLLRNSIDVKIDQEDSEVLLTVKNYQYRWELPKTGGMGTTLFTAIGSMLMISAFFLYMRRRKETV